MAAIFDTENNRPTQYDYIPPVFAVNDNSGVSKQTPILIFVLNFVTCISNFGYCNITEGFGVCMFVFVVG